MNNMIFIKRIDSLGRIVIPKEIRRKLKVEENENMQLSLINDSIVIKKHNILNDYENKIKEYGNILKDFSYKKVIITSREKIVFSSEKNLLDKEITDVVINYIINRESLKVNKIEIIKNIYIEGEIYGLPIIVDSDVIGMIILYDTKLSDRDKLALEIVNKLICKSLM